MNQIPGLPPGVTLDPPPAPARPPGGVVIGPDGAPQIAQGGGDAPASGGLPPGVTVDPTPPKAPAGPSFPQEAPNVLERVGHGADRTLQGIHQAFLEAKAKITGDPADKQAVKDYTQGLNDDEALYQGGRGPNAGVDWASLAGSAGIASPLMLIPGGQGVGATAILPRAALGAATGGLDAAAQPTKSGELADRLINTGVGAVTGGVAAPIAGAAGDKLVEGLNWARGQMGGIGARLAGENTPERVLSEVPEILNVPDPAAAGEAGAAAGADPLAAATRAAGEAGTAGTGAGVKPQLNDAQRDLIAEGQKMISQTGQLDAEQLARKANLLANQLQPTTSMVTRDPADWTLERNLQKLAQSPEESLSQTGDKLTKVYQANDQALTKGLQNQAAPFGDATQEARGMVIMQGAQDLAKQSQKDVSQVYDAVRDAKGEQLGSDARNLASTLDELKDNTYAEKLVSSVSNKLKRFGMLDGDGNLTNNSLTVSQSEELRKFVNTLPNDYGKKDIINAIDADVLSGTGEDAFQGARAAAKARFDMLRNPATQSALENLGELSQGKTAQNFIQRQVISAPDQDVAALMGTIGQMPQKSQDAAMAAVKGGVMDYLHAAAVNPNSEQFSGANLGKAMRVIGDNKLDLVLGKAPADKLRSLAQAALDATYQPPYAAVNNSNTTPMLLSLSRQARAIPGVPLVVNENLEKIAARSGYASQLANALKAKAAAPEVGIPQSVQQALADALAKGGGPVGAQALYNLRQPQGQQPQGR